MRKENASYEGFLNYYDYDSFCNLIKACFEHIGKDEEEFLDILRNVANSPYGAAAGFSGFIYYSETVDFCMKNKEKIVKRLEEEAEELGENCAIDVVKGFHCFKDDNDITTGDIGKALYSEKKHDELLQIYNALSWYTLEEVAFYFDCYESSL